MMTWALFRLHAMQEHPFHATWIPIDELFQLAPNATMYFPEETGRLTTLTHKGADGNG